MSPLRKNQLALRTRILLFTGAVITVIMLTSSAAILFGFRSLTVNGAVRNAENIAKAFEIPVLNEFVKKETEDFSLREQLGALVNNYRNKAKNIKFIKILDNENRIIAHTDWRKVNETEPDSLAFVNSTRKIVTEVRRDPHYGAIIETVVPVEIAGKRWGVMKIGFAADNLLAKLKEFYFILLFTTLLAIFAALGVLYVISGRLTRALSELVGILDSLDFDTDKTEHASGRTDETEFLYRKFEEMRARLQRSREELLRAQKQIYQAEKLASIGRLASGVAHEINNPLNGIKSCLYAIEKNPENTERNKEYLELIDEGITNIELIVKKLLGFARQKGNSDEKVNVRENIEKVLSLLDYRLRQKQVETERNFIGEPVVKADAQLLQEVFMNIIINALDAVDEKGKISVSVYEKDAVAVVEIADNGAGISEEDSGKIFDPFYTTKEPGKGTGLGLSVSLGIIDNIGGSIEVESEPGKGAKFIIKIPLK